ncbi:MAG: HAD family hydrolase [Planctomycetes bacterium]|nr:HAD family hydrolase [Planctomycetota bacterium]
MTAADQGGPRQSAAFFDVDGTLAKTTIVHYYVYFRRRRMSRAVGAIWLAFYWLKCIYYLLLDKISRSRMNVVFYRSYRRFRTKEILSMARDCHDEIVRPRFFPEGGRCVESHRRAGRQVVFVTGSVDFTVQPLAEELGVQCMLARSLVESNGAFTGELDGPPIGEEEKARQMRRYADENDIDLSKSYAYGDSIADLPMLEAVGMPHVVNPDRALQAIARARGWPTHHWTVGGNGEDATE